MSRSTDPGHFFQTDASEATRSRRAAKSGNKNGDPIKLQSKILDVILDPHSKTSVYVAESAGCVRRVDIKSKDSKIVYRGPAAPVTSVAIGGKNGNTVFAGCWDKDVWSWEKETRVLGRKYKGHTDFVKTVICAKLGGKDIMISGSADTRIMVWDTETGARIHNIRCKDESMLAIQSLAIDPFSSSASDLVLLSSSSDPHIRRWQVSIDTASQIIDSSLDPENGEKASILEHETSVYKILFDTENDDGDLWTASADGTAKCLSRGRDWKVEETLEHGDYVRAVAITPVWVVTAGRSEDIKVWDRSTGKLWFVYEGHYEEVTGLVVLGERDEIVVVSVSIDGTVRTWPLSRKQLDVKRKEKEDEESGVVKEVEAPKLKGVMTAEEEAELAELMDED